MRRPDATPDNSDHEFDESIDETKANSLLAAIGETLWGLLPGLWIGAQAVASFVVYPATIHTLSDVLTYGRRARSVVPVSELVYFNTALATDGIAIVCALLLLVSSIGSIFRFKSQRRTRISISMCYVIAIAQLLWSGTTQVEGISAPYTQMPRLQASVSSTSIIQIVAVLVSMVLSKMLQSSRDHESGKTIV